MPAVGRISTNLSLKDCAVAVTLGRTRLFTIGFFLAITTFGFALPVAFGFGGGATFFTTALRLVVGAGATAFFCAGPVPLRPSITIFPSWV